MLKSPSQAAKTKPNPTDQLAPMPPELGPTLFFAPPGGWHAFQWSAALTDLFWERLSSWRYLNLTSNSSTWECPRHATLASLVFDDAEVICELSVRFVAVPEHSDCTMHGLLEQLRVLYGIDANTS